MLRFLPPLLVLFFFALVVTTVVASPVFATILFLDNTSSFDRVAGAWACFSRWASRYLWKHDLQMMESGPADVASALILSDLISIWSFTSFKKKEHALPASWLQHDIYGMDAGNCARPPVLEESLRQELYSLYQRHISWLIVVRGTIRVSMGRKTRWELEGHQLNLKKMANWYWPYNLILEGGPGISRQSLRDNDRACTEGLNYALVESQHHEVVWGELTRLRRFGGVCSGEIVIVIVCE